MVVGRKEIDGAKRHEGFDHRQGAPGLYLGAQCGFYALDTLGANMYGQSILCERDMVCRVFELDL